MKYKVYMRDGHTYLINSLRQLTNVEIKHDAQFAKIISNRGYKPSDVYAIKAQEPQYTRRIEKYED